ncbi:unnamed protein product [Meloidogyne enterolobii]|uniref:Uncharacterized protein n=1 Tax=Meloidogyne enterolobii TaxID=390850 RepID=A0ACB0Z7I3_MELEN
MPQVPQKAPNLNSNKNSSRIQKIESSPPPKRRRERQRSVPAPIVQKIVVRRFEISPSTSKNSQHECLPLLDNNVIRQQEVTTQSPPSKRQNQSQQIPPTPTIQQNDVGGGRQQREEEEVVRQRSLTPQQNNGEILNFVQNISEQKDLIKEMLVYFLLIFRYWG